MPKLKAVIFDMDGVIIDSEPIHHRIVYNMLEDLNIVISATKFNDFVGLSNEEFWSTLKKQFNLKDSINYLTERQLKKTIEYLEDNNVLPINGVISLLLNLKKKGYKTALASSSPLSLIKFILEKLKIKDFFTVTVSGEFFEKSKPHPEIFLHTADILNVSPEECIVIEDSHNGVTAAKRAYMKCIGFQNVNSGNQNLTAADLIVNSFKEINIELLNNFFYKNP